MRLLPLGLVVAAGMAAISSSPASPRTPHSSYRVSARIPGPDGLWDYVSVDRAARRLYIGKKGGLVSLDLADRKAKPVMLYHSIVIHQALPIGRDRLVATGGPSNTAFVLEGRTGNVLATIPTGKDTDAAAFDARTGRAVTFNRGDSSATVIDVDHARVVATIALPTRAEFGIGDGSGLIYVNLAHDIAVIDVARAKIVRKYPLKGCEEPTGLALDRRSALLVSACSNGVATVMTTAGRQVARLKVGSEPDAAFLDEARRLVFVPSGGDGTLTVISLANAGAPRVVQTLKTEVEARTGAVDPVTGSVYLPVGKLLPPAPGEKWPSVVPGTFEILVVTPRHAS